MAPKEGLGTQVRVRWLQGLGSPRWDVLVPCSRLVSIKRELKLGGQA